MPTTPRKLFVNLPVENLDKSVEFFTALGFEFNPQFTDEKATCMILSEDAYVMLLVKDFFSTFTTKPIGDLTATTPAILALACGSSGEVDELVAKALAAGATPGRAADENSPMHTGSFHDLDGHLWEIFWMEAA
jgi:predicted lactoylglutathione lyase